MSSVSLESGLGTISFDGQVVELTIDVGPSTNGVRMVMKLSDADRAGLEALIQEVKAAA